MLDTSSGRIAYAVLSFGGFLGFGDKLFAVPWNALSVNIEDHSLVFSVEKEALLDAPGFDKDNWPETADSDRSRLTEIYTYYGYPPYWN